ncbi:MAG: 2-polyprenyl-3-methyl-6-methoxy-1,4-benzoquinone monooxygenase [Methylophilales bacterium]|nr:2-polyprenyl-3-methyl-6-methoxy-1,4-benzoquinone monooxygenase [Methylophilales bacterium]
MIDQLISEFDKGLRAVLAPAYSNRPHPKNETDTPMSDAEIRHAAALMRVNHTGEVCAQALYNGQALTAHNSSTVAALQHAAQEETEHLAWCEKRINELGGRKSLLNPLWYAGSFALGALAGVVGDKWSLGFLAETEHQVGKHLQSHLDKLPAQDTQSRAIVSQMQQDEAQHAVTAIELGAAILPVPVQLAMRLSSKLMTTITYRL